MSNQLNGTWSKPSGLTAARLTDGERLWVWRKFRAKLSRQEVMAHLAFGRDRISDMENDIYPVLARVGDGSTTRFRPPIEPSLSTRERLALARRRSGMQLRAAAKAYGVSHMTFLKLEEAGSRELLAWWQTL